MRKILLGDGISAKIFSFYNPEYLRISPACGAQVDVEDFKSSIILSRLLEVDNFFVDIGLEQPKDLNIPIGYFYDGKVCQGNPPINVQELIMHKKLSALKMPPSLFKTESLLAEPYLAQSQDEMATYNLRAEKLINRLNDNLQGNRDFIHERVNCIMDDTVVTETNKKLEYSHLVSTIPAYIFWEIYKGSHAEQKSFSSFPFYVRRLKKYLWSSLGYPALPDCIMCYFPESKFSFDRVRAIPELQDDDFIIESPVSFAEAKELKSARIIRNYDNIAPPKIMFLGRYAQWNPDIVVSDIIRKSSQKYLAESIWSDQKFFNKHFVVYAPDAQYVQNVVKDYILHLISETDSLLNTINWKMGADKFSIEMEREKILEEFIDIFKFWLSIGHMFGFDVDDFAYMYWKKSEKLREKYGFKK